MRYGGPVTISTPSTGHTAPQGTANERRACPACRTYSHCQTRTTNGIAKSTRYGGERHWQLASRCCQQRLPRSAQPGLPLPLGSACASLPPSSNRPQVLVDPTRREVSSYVPMTVPANVGPYTARHRDLHA